MFSQLYESYLKNELILIDGGFCRFHKRRDNSIVIYEIISTKSGAGTLILEKLKHISTGFSIIAKCPQELDSNLWYSKKGFSKIGEYVTKKGKILNIWELKVM